MCDGDGMDEITNEDCNPCVSSNDPICSCY